jgi:hypothetical protein
MGPWVAVLVGLVQAVGKAPKTIWGGLGVGIFVGVIIALITGDKWITLYGCAAGLAAGILLELIIRLNSRMER